MLLSAPGVVGVSSMPSSSMSDSWEGMLSLREDSCLPRRALLDDDDLLPFFSRRCDFRSSSASMAFTVYSLDKGGAQEKKTERKVKSGQSEHNSANFPPRDCVNSALWQ